MLHPSAIWGTIFSTLVSADVQVFSMVFTFGACSSSILGAHHTGDRGGARTLDPCVSSFVIVFDSTLYFSRRALATAAVGASPKVSVLFYGKGRELNVQLWLKIVKYISFAHTNICKKSTIAPSKLHVPSKFAQKTFSLDYAHNRLYYYFYFLFVV